MARRRLMLALSAAVGLCTVVSAVVAESPFDGGSRSPVRSIPVRIGRPPDDSGNAPVPVIKPPTTKPITSKPPTTKPVATKPPTTKPPTVPPVVADPTPPSIPPVLTPIPSKPTFVIGVWYQPIRLMPLWKSRGINTLVGYDSEGGIVSREAWTKAARDAGLMYITQPTGDLATDGADPYLMAWSQPDEPDGAGNISPADIRATYKSWKTQSDKPVFLNLDGWKMQWRPAQDYINYCKGGDIIAFDYYVANRGDAPGGIHIIGDRVTTLKKYSKNKPIFSFIESSDQDLRLQDWVVGTPLAALMRAPTPDEMQAQIDQTVTKGGSGIVYFPDMIGLGFEGYDGTTPELEAQMIKANTDLMSKYAAPQPQ